MSIIETFYILFKSDTSSIKKGAEEAEAVTEKVAASLKKVDAGATTAGRSFLGFAHSASRLLAAYVGAGAVLSTFKTSASYINDIGNASRALNVNVEDLDAWGYAVTRAGGTAQG